MGWSIVRRVTMALALIGAALAIVVGEHPMAAAGRPWLVVLYVGAELALIVGAALIAVVGRSATCGLAIATGLAIGGLGLTGHPAPRDAIGSIATALVVPLLLLLVVVVLPIRGRSRTATMSAAVVAAVAFVGRALVYDPFTDVDCVGPCRPNPILVTENVALAHLFGPLGAVAVTVFAVLVAWPTSCTLTARNNGGLGRPAQRCAVAGAVVLGVDSARRLATGTSSTTGIMDVTGLAAVSSTGALVGATLILAALEPLRARRNVHRVTRLLASAEGCGDVQSILREGFGDRRLRLGYWDGGGYRDERGEPVHSSGRAQTELTSRGDPIALIVHGRESVSTELVAQQLGARSRLAIHNEALTFELRRRAAEVARSRRRIVEVSDAERQRLERDLHDGAQQRLLALSFELRRGQRAAQTVDDIGTGATFEAANTLVHTALEQLRDLAHGIHPATLSGAGLQEALIEMTSERRNVSITIDTTDPTPAAVDATLYNVASAALAGTPPDATLGIVVRRQGAVIVLAIDGVPALPEGATDRVAAVGGTCTPTATGVEVVVPCAS